MYNLLEWLGFWHYSYRQWGGHMLIVVDNLIVHLHQIYVPIMVYHTILIFALCHLL